MDEASRKFFEHKEPYMSIQQVLNVEKQKQPFL